MQPVGCEVMYSMCVCFRGEHGFLDCDDICMCVVNKQFELIESVFDFVLCWPAGSVCLFGVCSRPWSVCKFVLVPYVNAVVAVTITRVLFFVLHVCMLRECEDAKVTTMLVWVMEAV